MSDRGSVFTSKFWSSLCYFLGIKQKLSTAFYPQTDGQTERQNSTMETYLQAFVNFKQNDWARLLPMAEFAYNNAKNASTGYTPFELNCGYHPRVSYEEDVDPCSKSKLANDLANSHLSSGRYRTSNGSTFGGSACQSCQTKARSTNHQHSE